LCQFAATSTAAIQALIDRGVNVRELRILDDSTPLHVAARRCRDADVFEMLVKVCGIDLEARNCERDTCLHYAARRGNDFSLRWLLNAGADMNCVRRNGSTPLHDANFHSGAVILLAAGANVGARDNAGRTALHRVPAAHRRSIEVTPVLPLIAAGADLDVAMISVKLLARCWLIMVGPLFLTKLKPRAGRLPRRDSTLCDIEHLNFASAFNRCESTRCKCAKSCSCVWPRRAVDSVSHLVEDCDHGEALLNEMNSMRQKSRTNRTSYATSTLRVARQTMHSRALV
jgi:hypothetical protein